MNVRSTVFVICVSCMSLCGNASAQEVAQATKPVEKSPVMKSSEKPSDKSGPPKSVATRADRLDLETTIVTGNRELPKVLYIVPWKKAELGDLPAQPFNTLLDEVLRPVDRDVFKREVKYFQAVNTPAASAIAEKPAAAK